MRLFSFRRRVAARVSPLAGAAIGAFALSLVAGAVAGAQADLSSQGFGYPPGQLSSHAAAAGGSIAEIDPLSPINPAAIAQFGSRILFFQIEPEFRSVTTSNGTDRTTTARYPNVLGAIPVGSSWVFSVSASTLLDRTSSASFTNTQVLNDTESVPITTTYKVDGALDDIRLAAAWSPTDWLHLGVGGHAITGRNLVSLTQDFPDTTVFSDFTQQRTLGFRGSALSGGVLITTKYIAAGVSAREGGPLNLSVTDTTLSEARVPNRFGASLAYTGFPGSAISIRTSRDDWSAIGSLGSPGTSAVDTWDTSIGADIAGPRFGDRILFLRGGFRTRTLPFQADAHTVTENSVTGGLGTTFAGGHVITDLAIIHATRSAAVAASEQAWTISIGIAVRP